jgi:SAM-dependent methyltransferase
MTEPGLRVLNDISRKYRELFLKEIEEKKILLEDVDKCICCGNDNFEKLLDKDRFDLPFGSYLCNNCGLVVTSPRIKQESLPYYYEKFYHPLNYGRENLENQVALFKKGQGKKIFDYVFPHLPKTSRLRILEIGAGVGNVLDEFRDEARKNHIDTDLLGTEYSHECIKQCETRNIEVIHGNAASVLSLHKTFDLIILSHVFEHFIDLYDELETLKTLLSEKGILYIEVPGILKNHDKPYYDFSFLGYSVHAHMYNFSLVTLKNVVERSGFILKEGNEEVEAIFQISPNVRSNIVNDSLRIKHYLEFLKDNQPFASQQKRTIDMQNEKISKLKEEIKAKNKENAKLKERIEAKDNEISKLKAHHTRILSAKKDLTSTSIWKHPLKKYKLYKHLTGVISAPES